MLKLDHKGGDEKMAFGQQRPHFNFYEQHAVNQTRTRWLNFLLPWSMILVAFLFGFLLALLNLWANQESFGRAMRDVFTVDYLQKAAIILLVWWFFVWLHAKILLKHPVDKVMKACQATEVSADWKQADPQVNMFDNVVGELAMGYGMKKPATYIVEDTNEPNAFAVGSPDHAGVAITRPLLDMLDRDELSGVMGHELAHVAAEDSKTSVTFAAFVSGLAFVTVLGWFLVRCSVATGSDRDRDSDDENSGSITLAVVGIGLILMIAGYIGKLSAILMQFAMSRTREYDADAMSAKVNMTSQGLIKALTKIDDWVAAQSGKMKKQAALPQQYANLYLVSNKTHLLDDHPSTADRIARLEKM